MIGIITKSTGSWYLVKSEDGKMYQCRIVGKIKLDELKLTNPAAVGDYVDFELEREDENIGYIKHIHPRKNYIVRQSPRKKHQLHFLASNVDQAVVVVTITSPNIKIGFIDRFLLMTEPYSIPTIIVFNKSDLYTTQDNALFEDLSLVYRDMNYTSIKVSSINNVGIDELKSLLKDKRTLISGQSGVGKSTLVNKLEPALDLKTEEISAYSGKGQHTTTFAEMFDLSFGGEIIDTPGIKTLAFSHLTQEDVAHNMRDIFALSKNCKYNNCLHRNEPNCAVKEGIELGYIAEFRYFSYLNLLEEIEDQNYWDRHKDF